MGKESEEFPYFGPRRIEGGDLDRTPYRPLGEFSDRVVQELPALLTQVRSGVIAPEVFSEIVEGWAEVVDLPEDLSGRDLRVARVDAQFAYNAVVNSPRHVREAGDFVKPGPVTSRLAGSLAHVLGRPGILTYEDYIIDNPSDDMRTFADGQARWSEAGFINAHFRVEGHLDNVVMYQRMALEMIEVGDKGSEQLLHVLRAAIDNWSFNKQFTAILKDLLDTPDFAIFREYVGGYKDPNSSKEFQGASGQQSGRIRETSLLLDGARLVREPGTTYLIDFHKTYIYFPRVSIDAVFDAYQRSLDRQTLRVMTENGQASDEVIELLDQLGDRIYEWRKLHYETVKKHLAGGTTKGTGGTFPAGYLTQMMKDTKGK